MDKKENIEEISTELTPETLERMKEIEARVYERRHQLLQGCSSWDDVAYNIDGEGGFECRGKEDIIFTIGKDWYVLAAKNEEQGLVYVADCASETHGTAKFFRAFTRMKSYNLPFYASLRDSTSYQTVCKAAKYDRLTILSEESWQFGGETFHWVKFVSGYHPELMRGR